MSVANVIRVMIAEDHNLVRKGIKGLISKEEDIEVVAEAENGEAVIGWLGSVEVDLILMDIKMPITDGISATERVKKMFPKVQVLGLSMFEEDSFITKMLSAGASGYILKTTNREELLEGIRTVAAGGTFFPKEVSEIIMSKYLRKESGKARDRFPEQVDLTEREMDVLKLIADEFTNKEIGDKLFISPRTVDSHRRNIMQKLGVKNTAGLVKYASMKNII
ncbi:MAG: response regulator transcription factor [Bacteroidia bacterium]|nr:response regulator transcription factor [Bacteroidia bacterium]